MDLFFNELSIKNRDSLDYHSIITIVSVYKELLKYNITTCRIATDDNNKLFQMINDLPNSINVKNFYFAFFKSPYESEMVEKKQDDYYEHTWTYNSENCIGFALAFLLNSASFSIYGSDWIMPFMEMLKDDKINCVKNICVKEHVDIHLSKLQDETEIELITCDIQVSDKKIVLRNDHGMDILEDFSRRLIQSPYLLGVINSLPYNPYERKFIKKVKENGLIEIVLPWTDKGYGIVIKTTGRTFKETKKIAEILEEEFGYI